MEVKVNGEIIELGDSYPAITKRSIDIEKPSARFIEITNKFSLPETNGNLQMFEHPKAIGSDGRSMDKYYDVSIYDVFQLFRGNGFVESTSRGKLNLQIVDRSSELFKALEADIKTIAWDDKDTELSTAAIDLLDTNDLTTCWHWGKLCLHENAVRANTDQISGGGDTRCIYSRPSFNVQSFLKRAIGLQGYSYVESSVKLAFSGWHNDFFLTSYQKTYAATAYTPAGSLTLTGLDTNDFAHAHITAASGSIDMGTLKSVFRFRGVITSTGLIDLIIRGTDQLDATKITESKVTLGVGTNEVDFTTSDFQSDDGITVTILLSGTGTVTMTGYLYTLHSDKDSLDLSANPFLGYKIKAYDNLPELTFIDLFKLICVIGNQYQQIDTYTKVFDWGSLANLSKMNAVDWSDKFVEGSEQVTAKFSGLFRKNILRYTNDITVSSEHGKSYFETDNETLEAEGDYIALKFGASYDVTINSNLIGHVRVYNNLTRIPDQEISLRLFCIDDDKLTFDKIIWTNNYTNWFASLKRIRLITCEVNLSKLDFLKWTEKQLVYINHFKTVFIVLEISNFIPGRLTKVKLLAYGRA